MHPNGCNHRKNPLLDSRRIFLSVQVRIYLPAENRLGGSVQVRSPSGAGFYADFVEFLILTEEEHHAFIPRLAVEGFRADVPLFHQIRRQVFQCTGISYDFHAGKHDDVQGHAGLLLQGVEGTVEFPFVDRIEDVQYVRNKDIVFGLRNTGSGFLPSQKNHHYPLDTVSFHDRFPS